jgi:hypothetical protein
MVCCTSPLLENQYETAGRVRTNGLLQQPFDI